MPIILNDSQKRAVSHFEGPCCVLAGPGSGKTAVITHRTKKLIADYGVNPSEILVITFTRAAAEQMKRRFGALMESETAGVTFGTFHAVFFTVLKLAYRMERSNIITEEQRYQLMRAILSSTPVEYRDEAEMIGNLLGEISVVKNTRTDIQNFYSAQCGADIFRSIYEQYDRRLRQNRWIDFDDMLTYTYELFVERPDILSAWQKKYKFILIDEFQDINPIQYDIIRMMAKPEDNLFIVGDDDQSIYRFRGSKPELMQNFEKDYPGAKRILLDVNYRCDANIVKASLRLIGHNRVRFDKKIRAGKPAERPVAFVSFRDQREESLFLMKKMEEGIQRGGAWRDYAVLFRTNTQPRLLTALLMEYNIPFQIRDRVPNLYEHWIARDLFTYIRLAQGSRARRDFLQIMNRPKRYIGRDSLPEETVSFDEWARMYEKQPWVAERIERLRYDLDCIARMSPYAAVNYIRRGIGYDEFLAEYADYRGIEKEELVETLEELHAASRDYKSFDAWQEQIKSYTAELEKKARERRKEQNAITLATLHSAKGLEFPSVFLIDANEGLMPYRKAVLEPDLEEERRMFYVGMTRAIRELTVCSIRQLGNREAEISRFVDEAMGGRSADFK